MYLLCILKGEMQRLHKKLDSCFIWLAWVELITHLGEYKLFRINTETLPDRLMGEDWALIDLINRIRHTISDAQK